MHDARTLADYLQTMHGGAPSDRTSATAWRDWLKARPTASVSKESRQAN